MLNCWCTWRRVHSCSHTGTDTYTPTLKQVQRPRCRDRETRTQAQIQTHTYKPTPTTLNLTHTYNPLAHYTSIHPFTKNTHRLIPTYKTSTKHPRISQRTSTLSQKLDDGTKSRKGGTTIAYEEMFVPRQTFSPSFFSGYYEHPSLPALKQVYRMPRALERLLPPLGKVNRSSDNAYCRISALGELEYVFGRFAVVVCIP